MSTLYPPEKRQPPARLAAERGAVPCRLDGRALEAVVLLPVEVILVGVDLRVHLDLDEIRRFPGHVVHLREGAQGQRLVGQILSGRPGVRQSCRARVGLTHPGLSGRMQRGISRRAPTGGSDEGGSQAQGDGADRAQPRGPVPHQRLGRPLHLALPRAGHALSLRHGAHQGRQALSSGRGGRESDPGAGLRGGALRGPDHPGRRQTCPRRPRSRGPDRAHDGFRELRPRLQRSAARDQRRRRPPGGDLRERGKPTRAAIGCRGLGGNASVEIIVQLLFSGTDVRPPLARDHFAR